MKKLKAKVTKKLRQAVKNTLQPLAEELKTKVQAKLPTRRTPPRDEEDI